MSAYSPEDIATAWSAIRSRFPKPDYGIQVAVWNAGESVWKSFLDITAEEIQRGLNTNIGGAFAFSREAILSFKENEIDETNGKRGSLIFTGATSSVRGNITTSLFSAGKHGARALSQSLAKEFGKQNIHVSHVCPPKALRRFVSLLNADYLGHHRRRLVTRKRSSPLHGVKRMYPGIITERSKSLRNNPEWEANQDVRLSPDSIAKVRRCSQLVNLKLMHS